MPNSIFFSQNGTKIYLLQTAKVKTEIQKLIVHCTNSKRQDQKEGTKW